MTDYMRSAAKKEINYKSKTKIFKRVVKILKPIGRTALSSRNGQFSTSLYDGVFNGIAEYIDMYEELLDCYGDDYFEYSKEDQDELASYLADNDVINNKVAVFMLRQIAKGEVKL